MVHHIDVVLNENGMAGYWEGNARTKQSIINIGGRKAYYYWGWGWRKKRDFTVVVSLSGAFKNKNLVIFVDHGCC